VGARSGAVRSGAAGGDGRAAVSAVRAGTFGDGALADPLDGGKLGGGAGGATGLSVVEDDAEDEEGGAAGGVAAGGAEGAPVPRAAGIDEGGRAAGADAAVRAADFAGSDGDSIAISAVSPTNPIRIAATPQRSSVFSDMPWRTGGRE
jgi:hypothetical protein